MNFTVKILNKSEVTVDDKTTLRQLSERFRDDFEYPILLAKVNNELVELNKTLRCNDTVEFLDITDSNALRAYQRSLSFVMIYAVKEILGKKTKVIIEHSIKKNYYCEIVGHEITDDLVTKIKNKMTEVIENDLPFLKHHLDVNEAIKLSEEFGLTDKIKILKFRRTSNVNFYQLDWFYNYFYGQLVPSAGYLKVFDLKKQIDGFLLQFPESSNPKTIIEAGSFEKISRVFRESSSWARILKIDTVGSLNEKICKGELQNIINISEGLHEKKIAEIADMICKDKKQLVLVAGPSSSGKTTFAHRLSTQLMVNGMGTYIISMDDYFKDQFCSMDDDNDYDFEALDAVDVPLINKHLSELLEGETVNIPSFNFVTGKRENKNRMFKKQQDEIIIVEGIHGLNDEVCKDIQTKDKFKIFISALTQLNVDYHNRIATTDTRLIRRIVRDSQFRKLNAKTTIKNWPAVTTGEANNIFPFQENADAIFNSALIYELAVLKPFVEPILFNISSQYLQYAEARRLIKFLDCFLGVSSEGVPRNSLLREFIGGSL